MGLIAIIKDLLSNGFGLFRPRRECNAVVQDISTRKLYSPEFERKKRISKEEQEEIEDMINREYFAREQSSFGGDKLVKNLFDVAFMKKEEGETFKGRYYVFERVKKVGELIDKIEKNMNNLERGEYDALQPINLVHCSSNSFTRGPNPIQERLKASLIYSNSSSPSEGLNRRIFNFNL